MNQNPYDPGLNPLQDDAICFPNYPARCGSLGCCAAGGGATGPTGPAGPAGPTGATGAGALRH